MVFRWGRGGMDLVVGCIIRVFSRTADKAGVWRACWMDINRAVSCAGRPMPYMPGVRGRERIAAGIPNSSAMRNITRSSMRASGQREWNVGGRRGDH